MRRNKKDSEDVETEGTELKESSVGVASDQTAQSGTPNLDGLKDESVLVR